MHFPKSNSNPLFMLYFRSLKSFFFFLPLPVFLPKGSKNRLWVRGGDVRELPTVRPGPRHLHFNGNSNFKKKALKELVTITLSFSTALSKSLDAAA